MLQTKITFLKEELQKEVTENILPFWQTKAIDPTGGFAGQILSNNAVVNNAPKGAVLNARILWTFSSAYNTLKNPDYLNIANRAFDYLLNYFFDKEFGGIYWMLDYQGKPLDTKKQIYAQAFAIYALSEYYIATQNPKALKSAMDLFEVIENHSFDSKLNGYFEAYSREWKLLSDLRLSDKDENEAKTMNTHLHILEAYTTLYQINPDEKVLKQLENLVLIHFDKILNSETFHFKLFFNENWVLKSDKISFGHDIEGAWLMQEAAIATKNEELIKKSKEIAIKIADVTLTEGIASDGSILYEADSKRITDSHREWWTQAEAILGFVNAYQNSGNELYIDVALKTWEFTKKYIICPEGEWWWGVQNDYSIMKNDDKAGPWKCPYHNSRACLEMIKRFS